MNSNKVIRINPQGRSTKWSYLLEECRNITLRYLPELFKRMLDNADDNLFELADKAESNQEQNSYFDAMRQLRINRATLQSGFEEGLKDNFDQVLSARVISQNATREQQAEEDEISIIDDHDLEESLAISGMAEKIHSRYSSELYAIEQRFSAVLNDKTIKLDDIPIGPKPLCMALESVIKPLDNEIKIKLIIYKLFDKHVLTNLKPLYDEVNTLFISAGILPRLKMRIEKKEEHYTSRNIAAEMAWLEDGAVTSQSQNPAASFNDTGFSPTLTSLDNGAGYRESESSGALLNTLQKLLTNQPMPERQYYATPGNNNGNSDSLDTDTLIKLLSEQQKVELPPTGKQLTHALENIKTSGTVNEFDDQIINIVEMLFDYILDDPNLPTIAKGLLARLQIPMLKIALIDSTFFSDKKHSARKLLDTMAKATLGLSHETNFENSTLIDKIESIIDRINNEFIRDAEIFSTSLEEFETFLAEQAVLDEQAKELDEVSLNEREQLALSRAWVTDVIATLINNKKLPKPIFELLNGPWMEVMLNTYLNEGDKSQQWKENIRFIDILVWSATPLDANADKKRLGNIILQLVETLKSELENINYETDEIQAILNELEAVHISGIRGSRDDQPENVIVRAMPEQWQMDDDHALDINSELEAMRRELSEIGDIDSMFNDIFRDINPDHTRRKLTAEDLMEEDVEVIEMSSATLHKKSKPEIDDHFWHMVQQLETGQWITLCDDNNKERRIKLAWKSDLLGECTFINWHFKIAADLSFNELAGKFRTGKAQLIENLPLFERAFDAVANTLQWRQEKTA